MGRERQVFGREAAEELARLGFRKRGGFVFTRNLAPEILGWLGLNIALNKDRSLEVNPVVGVRHQRLERLVAELMAIRYHPYNPPSLSIHVGYLTEAPDYSPLLVADDWERASVIGTLGGIVQAYGLPFMTATMDIAALAAKLETGRFGIPHQTALRLPVAYFVLNETGRAQQYLAGQLQELDGRADPQATQYRAFASRLLERLES